MDYKYQNLIKESHDFFSKLSDEDLFSSKVSHIYYNGHVTREKAQLFRTQFLQLNETKNVNGIKEVPKPIVIHLNSGGGDVLGIDIFESILFQARVPFCVLIEDLCASAATFLALYAPYRIMIDYSQYLIHDSAGVTFGKTGNSVVNQKYALDGFIRYKNLLRLRTKLSDKEIDHYIQRDKMIVAKDCLKKGIVDRVLTFPSIQSYQIGSKKNGNLSLPLDVFLKKTNFNTISVDLVNMAANGMNSVTSLEHIPFSSVDSIESFILSLDSMILNNENKSQIKPLLLQILPLYSYTEFFLNPIVNVGLLYRIALIQYLKIPVVAYCEGNQNLSTLFLSLMCPNRIALKPYLISTQFTYRSVEWAWKFVDQIYNTKIFMSELVRFGKQFSNLPNIFYSKLDKQIINITPSEQLKYKLIHHIIDSHPTKITNNNIRKYLKMNQISLNHIKNNTNSNNTNNHNEKKKKKVQKKKPKSINVPQ
jgi:ATP-dependent protease ClpP protease subunit